MTHLHSVYDTDAHFKIDAVTRSIKNDSSGKTVLIQGDHNSERFTFEVPRFVDGHDLSLCDVVQVHYTNTDSTNKTKVSKDIHEVTDLQISPESDDVVILSWLIDGKATRYAGSLHFAVKFKCTNGAVKVYEWNTMTYTGISVSSGIDNGEAIVEDYSDVLEQWRQELFNGSGGTGGGNGAFKIEVLEADPPDSELYDGRMWLLKQSVVEYVTAPVISLNAMDEDSITIDLNNASYDERGNTIDTYNVYLNGELVETVTLAPGAGYTFDGLTAGTTYAIKICGVSGEVESPASNVLSVTTTSDDTGDDGTDVEMSDVEYLRGYTARYSTQYAEDIALMQYGDRMVTVAYAGDKQLQYENGSESGCYLLPVDAYAIAITVECDGLEFGVNGFNYADGKYSYDLDSGWKTSGTTVEFTAGKFAYMAVVFKSNTASITDYDTSTIKVYIRKPVARG